MKDVAGMWQRLIVLGVTDVWSLIRKNSSNKLASLVVHLRQDSIHRIYGNFLEVTLSHQLCVVSRWPVPTPCVCAHERFLPCLYPLSLPLFLLQTTHSHTPLPSVE